MERTFAEPDRSVSGRDRDEASGRARSSTPGDSRATFPTGDLGRPSQDPITQMKEVFASPTTTRGRLDAATRRKRGDSGALEPTRAARDILSDLGRNGSGTAGSGTTIAEPQVGGGGRPGSVRSFGRYRLEPTLDPRTPPQVAPIPAGPPGGEPFPETPQRHHGRHRIHRCVEDYYGWYCWHRCFYGHGGIGRWCWPGYYVPLYFYGCAYYWGIHLYPTPPYGGWIVASGGWNPDYFVEYLPTFIDWYSCGSAPVWEDAGYEEEYYYDDSWIDGGNYETTQWIEDGSEYGPVTAVDLAELFLRLGDLHFKEGDYAAAARYFERAIEALPDHPAPRFALADALFALGDWGYAAFQIRRGVELDPSWLDLRIDRRDFYGDPADFDRHMAALLAFLADHPYDAAAWLVLGYNQYFTAEFGLASISFNTVLELNPEEEAVYDFLQAIERRRAEEDGEGASGGVSMSPVTLR